MFFLRVHSVDTNHPVSLEDAEFTTIHTARGATAAASNLRFSERRGIAHLFRRRRGSSSSLPSHGAESSLLFVVAVPNYLSFNDFIRFCGSRLDHVAELVFIRNDAMEDRYSVVIRLMNEMKADEFYGSFNGKKYSPGEAEVCHILFLASVDYIMSARIAGTPPDECTELPSCPVCLERLDADSSGIATTLCDHSFQCPCISTWTYLSCQVCRLCQKEDNNPACSVCGITENPWVCVICGFVGCGRYEEGRHAIRHYEDTKHCYSLHLKTQQIWDYVGHAYVHRLNQSKIDGKLGTDVNSYCRALGGDCDSSECSEDSGISGALYSSKVETIVDEYNRLLASQLENQRQYYESLLMEAKSKTESSISEAVEKAINLKIQGIQIKLEKSHEEKKAVECIHQTLIEEQQTLSAKYKETEKSLNGSLLGGLDESASSTPIIGTLDAEITPETIDFFVSDAEGDPDCPSEGYSSIEQALNALRQGKFVIVVDDENAEVEGNFVMAASFANPRNIAILIKHGSGIVSVGMKEEDLERLRLPLMSPETEDEDSSAPTFTITVDAKMGTSTGVSALDRAKTVLALSSEESKPEDFRRPGHVFPLKYRNGGVLRRAGHTEASVDLVALAGLRPVSVLSAVVDADDGSMASLPSLRKLSLDHSISIVSITDLIRYRRKREKIVERIALSRLPTKWGLFQAYCYRSKLDGTEHIAVVKGSIGNGEDVLVRVHSECLTGDIFGSGRCDCGNQLELAMQLIETAGRGAVVYLRGHEGRGIGLGHKLQAYNLQDQGHDTVQANIELGLAVDAHEYGIGAQILRDIGVRTMRLMTNNPAKFSGLKGYGLAVIGRVPVLAPITEENKKYLETKRTKMGHIYGSDIRGPSAGFIKPDKNNQGMEDGLES